MDSAEFDKMMADSSAYLEDLRESLRKMRPLLLAMKESHEAYIADIEQHPSMLFAMAPPLPSGGHAKIKTDYQKECAEAVVKVLRRQLATIKKGLGE